MKLVAPFVLPFLIAALAAQSPVPIKRSPRPQQMETGEAVEVNDAGDPIGSDGRPGKVVKNEPVEVNRNASAFCVFYLHSEPAKLMPGETGKLIITASLKDRAVLPSPAPLQVTSSRTQGLLALGEPVVLPAEIGRLPGAYRGRPVYDNWATIEIPVTVGQTAQIGKKQAVAIQMKFDLFDGTTAQSLGEFVGRAMGQIEIGQSYDPAVQGGYRPPAAAAVESAEPAAPIQPMADGGVPPESAAPAVGAADPLPVPDTDDPAIAAVPEPTEGPVARLEDDQSNLWILLAGGGALALVVLLLVLKKRN